MFGGKKRIYKMNFIDQEFIGSRKGNVVEKRFKYKRHK